MVSWLQFESEELIDWLIDWLIDYWLAVQGAVLQLYKNYKEMLEGMGNQVNQFWLQLQVWRVG